MAEGTQDLHRLPAAPVGGERQPRTSARYGAGDEQGPPEPIVDRHPRIDNDGGRLEKRTARFPSENRHSQYDRRRIMRTNPKPNNKKPKMKRNLSYNGLSLLMAMCVAFI